MKAIQINGEIKIFLDIPKTWKDENGIHLNIQNPEDFGFYDIVTPKYDSDIHDIGDLYWDEQNKIFTYNVLNKSFEETIEQIKVNKIKELKKYYNEILSETDWIIIRDKELDMPTDGAIIMKRLKLREECSNKENEINNLTEKIAVIKYKI